MSDAPELVEDDAGLSLVGGGQVLRADFSRMLPRLRQPNLSRELLVRAARIRGAQGVLRAVDATAGLGEDALLLAAAGFWVRLFERDPLIAALVDDGLRRARQTPELAEVASRMELVAGDSVQGLATLPWTPDVVYLDPMFPERRRKAATKKKLQLIQQLERPCEDEEGLLRAALAAGPRKVVVKRPLKGPCLGSVKPSHSVRGKVVRYDVIVP
ncbi:MAG: class I SAM-dependent methyltransferase [Coriobacteriales bacterium]|nr:class I SAM-dependent methyltransferase [Coriobacteriales bacterium]